MLKLFVFCLDSWIVNKGEKFVHDFGTWEHLEGGQGNQKVLLSVQMHMSSNKLQSVKNLNVQGTF
jgi:hypothetical protein